MLIDLLDLINEALAAAIVIVATSLLLYNLTRNQRDRVARTSAVVLACVTAAYIADVFVSLGPSRDTLLATLRLQWIGIAFLPAGMFHLSDALLATTGLPSRGRRRRVARLLYIISALFVMLAAFTNTLVRPVEAPQYIGLRASSLFPVYVSYFVIITAASFINVQRARKRCLTRNTRRRMGYLQFALLTPAVGIFPFSLVLPPGEEFSLMGLLLVNIANFVVILMLLFLAYPLSFFGSRVPDRVVKVALLRFLMRGPATGVLALVTIIFTTPATRILGLSGQAFMPFAVVAVVLLWQWMTAISLPLLEKRLVYPDDDDYDQLARLQSLSERMLSRTDLLQLLEAILSATCDYLRVNSAYVVSFNNEAEEHLVAAVGPTRPSGSIIQEEAQKLYQQFEPDLIDRDSLVVQKWHSYWIVPLYSLRIGGLETPPGLNGFMGIQARTHEIDLTDDERQMLLTFTRRASRALDDLALQRDILAALEGLLPQIHLTRSRAAEVEYRPGRQPVIGENGFADREQFVEQVKSALRHYWGGEGLSKSRLLELQVVQNVLPEHDDNPTKALRAVLQEAIERQRPNGDRKLSSPEWTLYNILEMRFIQKGKVRQVADSLYMSEPNLYRKQNVAIEAVADTIMEMERGVTNGS